MKLILLFMLSLVVGCHFNWQSPSDMPLVKAPKHCGEPHSGLVWITNGYPHCENVGEYMAWQIEHDLVVYTNWTTTNYGYKLK